MRPRQNPADFLRDWGATTVQADLNDPTSLPAALVRGRPLLSWQQAPTGAPQRCAQQQGGRGAHTLSGRGPKDSPAGAAAAGDWSLCRRSLPSPTRRTSRPTRARQVGIHTVIDCATARPEESAQRVDWEGKVALIQCAQARALGPAPHGGHWRAAMQALCSLSTWSRRQRACEQRRAPMSACAPTRAPPGRAQAMGIQRYVFFSIHNADRHADVPLMQIKARTEDFLAASGLDFTILRLCGFMQAIIGNYAVPILEEKQVWGTSDATRTAYLDSQARARAGPGIGVGLGHQPRLCDSARPRSRAGQHARPGGRGSAGPPLCSGAAGSALSCVLRVYVWAAPAGGAVGRALRSGQ